jgi:hypothetical protein
MHLCLAQSARVGKYGKRIPTVKMIGEYVSGVEMVRHASKNVRTAGPPGYHPAVPSWMALNKHSVPT